MIPSPIRPPELRRGASHPSAVKVSSSTPSPSQVSPPVRPSDVTSFLGPNWKVFREYWNHGANREIVKALAWKYLPGITLSTLILFPLGWLIALVAAIPAWLAARRGDKQVNELLLSGKLDKTGGALASITKIGHLWQESHDAQAVGKNVPRQIMEEFNKLLGDLFQGEPHSDAVRLRNALRMTGDSRWFGWLNHAFNAKQFYAGTAVGKVCRNLSQWGGQVPLVPIQILCRMPELVTMPFVILFNLPEIRQLRRL